MMRRDNESKPMATIIVITLSTRYYMEKLSVLLIDNVIAALKSKYGLKLTRSV